MMRTGSPDRLVSFGWIWLSRPAMGDAVAVGTVSPVRPRCPGIRWEPRERKAERVEEGTGTW